MTAVAQDKTKIRCHECGTNFSIRTANLPAHVTQITCTNCQAAIPLFERLSKPDAKASNTKAPAERKDRARGLDGLALAMGAEEVLPMAQEEGDDGAWLAIYGDIMSILLIFFILLFAISSIDQQKFAIAINSISEALGGTGAAVAIEQGPGADKEPAQQKPPQVAAPSARQKVLTDLQSKIRTEQGGLSSLHQTLQSFITEYGLQEQYDLRDESEGLILVARDLSMFTSGSATIRDQFKDPLRRVGAILTQIPNSIVIEGHTDDAPIRSAEFASNWELSAARATNVVRFLLDEVNLHPDRVSAAGFAYFRPRYDMASSEAYKNRRIEIVVKRKYSAELVDQILQLE